MTDAPWTRREWLAAMRAADWVKQPGPGSWWQHSKTGARFEDYNWTAKHGIAWEAWAARRETPPPF